MPEFQLAGERRTQQDILITWILRLAVAAVFLSVGYGKFDASSMWPKFFESVGLGQWFRYLTGILQIAGAALVLVPRTCLAGIALLACTMVGAAAIWIVRFGEPANAIIPAAALIGLVAIGAHARNVDRKTDAAADFPHASPGDVSPHQEQSNRG